MNESGVVVGTIVVASAIGSITAYCVYQILELCF